MRLLHGSMRRSAVLLAGAMVVAGGAALFAGDAGPHRARPPAASIAGAALAPAAAAAVPAPVDPASPIETSVVGITTASTCSKAELKSAVSRARVATARR